MGAINGGDTVLRPDQNDVVFVWRSSAGSAGRRRSQKSFHKRYDDPRPKVVSQKDKTTYLKDVFRIYVYTLQLDLPTTLAWSAS